MPIYAAEELLDCIPEDIFEFRNMLDKETGRVSITKIRDLDES
jgi:hypothetical protein